MKNVIFCSIFLCCSLMLGCNRNIDNKFNQFEKMTVTTPVETTNNKTTSDDTTEETTEGIIENVDEMLLLQKVMLNQMKVVSAPINSDEYYLKDSSRKHLLHKKVIEENSAKSLRWLLFFLK